MTYHSSVVGTAPEDEEEAEVTTAPEDEEEAEVATVPGDEDEAEVATVSEDGDEAEAANAIEVSRTSNMSAVASFPAAFKRRTRFRCSFLMKRDFAAIWRLMSARACWAAFNASAV